MPRVATKTNPFSSLDKIVGEIGKSAVIAYVNRGESTPEKTPAPTKRAKRSDAGKPRGKRVEKRDPEPGLAEKYVHKTGKVKKSHKAKPTPVTPPEAFAGMDEEGAQ